MSSNTPRLMVAARHSAVKSEAPVRNHERMFIHLLGLGNASLTILQHCESADSEDELWNETNPDIEALKTIIKDHFNSSCQTEEPMIHGAYARVFLYTLENGLQVIARVILPVRETVKTESEIAAMDMMRGNFIRRSIPRALHC
jgi:hypothetical protein